MLDLIAIGNISIDLYFKGDSLTFADNRFQLAVGGKYFCNYFFEGVGGGGANVAIGVSKHGLKTAVYGKIGNNPFKNIIVEKLRSNGVSSDLCQIEDNYFNVSSILLTAGGERTIINYNTPHQHMINDELLSKLSNSKFVYLGNLPDVSLTEKEKLLSVLKKNQQTTIANLGVKDCRRDFEQLSGFLKKIDILIINGYEFAELVKKPYEKIDFRKYQTVAADFFEGKIVVITDGEKGSYGYADNRAFFQKAIKLEKVTDTTGAGDAYTAAFISEFIASGDIEKSMLKGSNYAVKILSKIGAN
jgi:sugar/nucleoside kinase (ribokinase family)